MIALYPGAFKPPHRGHFNVVKSLLDGSYNGKVYDKDNYKDVGADILSNKSNEKPKIDKVIIFIGGGERNGITKEEATSIWQIYAKHLGNVEIVDGEKNPMFAAKDYAVSNPNTEFAAVTGLRTDKDFVDLRRITTFKNAPNVKGLAFAAAPDSTTRATDFRNHILSGNLDTITDFFPESLSKEEILDILTSLKSKIVAEIIKSNLSGYMKQYFSEQKEIIKEQVKPIELKEYIGSILEYMLDNDMNIQPLPEVKTREDEANAENFFGKTAFYDPNSKEIILYITGRHPKDICRSFTHEMVHHIQNLEGRLHNVQTQDTTSDDKLLELEKEAYTLGNITFRNWEDSIKNPKLNEEVIGEKIHCDNCTWSWEIKDGGDDLYLCHKCWHDNTPNKTPINEGRYDKIANRLSSIAFEFYKDVHDRGDKEGEFELSVGNQDQDPDVDIHSNQFEFDFLGKVIISDDTYQPDGGANAGFDDDGEEIQPMLNVKFTIPKNPKWSEVSFDIKDVVRHELEHLTQDGENERTGKYIPDDKVLRDLIKAGLLDKDEYFSLPKEVDAMIQGLYFKAKKSKQPFKDVVNDYLNKALTSLENKEKIRILWNKRLPKLGIKQRL